MATTKKLSDLFSFDQIANPAGGFSIAKSTPSMLLKPTPPAVPAPIPQGPITDQRVLPPAIQNGGAGPTPITTPVGGGPDRSPVGGGYGATGVAPASQSPIPPQYLNADGSFKTPDQVATDVGGVLAHAHGNGDVGALALEQFGGQNKTAEQLATEARRINNTRNDIAVGETDPYKVASESGIAYTPAELSAIEKAYAGVYDPALDTAMAKVDTKQKADAAKAAADAKANEPFTLGKNEVRYDGKGNPIAVGLSGGTAPAGPYTKGANPVIDAYVEGFKNGTYKASDIPDAYKDQVAQGVAQSKPALSKSSTDAISIIDALSADPNLPNLTGFRIQHPTSLFPGSDIQSTQNLAKQLKGILSLENRTQLKGQGAISDFEFRVLGDAASALGIDENGRTNLSPEDFTNQLNKMKLKLQVGETNLTDDELQYLNTKGYSPEQIRAYDTSQSFNDVGNTKASSLSQGNRPQRNNNPGNVKQGGLSDALAVGKDEQGHLIFPDAQTGFKALTADLTAKINGGSSHLPANPTIAQLGKVYAEDPNWPVKVAKILGVTTDTHTQAVPLANLVKAVATQEGFYA